MEVRIQQQQALWRLESMEEVVGTTTLSYVAFTMLGDPQQTSI
jgi:hypothetical protein